MGNGKRGWCIYINPTWHLGKQLLSEVNTFSHTINFCQRQQESTEDAFRKALPIWGVVSVLVRLLIFGFWIKLKLIVRQTTCGCQAGVFKLCSHGVCAILETIKQGQRIENFPG